MQGVPDDTEVAVPPNADVVVVGAGPAGAAAASHLALGGCRVVLFDKARFPRDKCCGDGLTTGALRRLAELGVRPERLTSWQRVNTAAVRTPAGRVFDFPLPSSGTFAAVVRRYELDASLVDIAGRHGALVAEGHTFRSLEHRGGRRPLEVSFVAPDGHPVSVRCCYVVGADGMWSPLRKAVGLPEPGYRGDWHAFRQYFRAESPEARLMWVFFDGDLLPGYAWSFPLADGRVNVGFGVPRRAAGSGAELRRQWAAILARPHVARLLGDSPHPEGILKTWPIPTAQHRSPSSALDGRVLFVGDAARAPDSMTGEGIGQALETAELAAGAIVGSGPRRSGAAAARYQSALGRGLLIDDRLSVLLSRAMSRTRALEASMRLAAATERGRRTFARWMFEDYPRAVVITPRRWRPGLLHRPGAFAGSP